MNSAIGRSLDRRQLLRIGLGGFGTVVIGGSLSACVSDSAASGDSDDELEVLKVGVAALPGSLDPIVGLGNATSRIYPNVFETLLFADQADNFALGPMLAQRSERIDDRIVEFELTHDVQFHDGSTFSAKDVEYSFTRLTKGIAGSELAASLMSTIERVEVVDDFTVRLHTSQPDPILEQRVASSWGSWILPMDYLESHGDEEFARNPVGTGPYQLEAFSPERLVLNRFEDYWGPKPIAKRVEYVLYPENSSRVTALLTGEVDIIAQLPPEQIPAVEERDGFRVISTVIDNLHLLRFNTTAPGLTDVRLRQALSLAIDRQSLIDHLWDGEAQMPRGHQFPSYGDLYFEDYPTPEYDPERAKQLVQESDYNGEQLTYELKPGYYTFDTSVAEAVVGMWSDIGVDAAIEYTDSADLDSVATWSNGPRFPDPAAGLWLLWSPGSSADKWWPGDEEFTRLGEALASTMDSAERQRLARELMQRWDAVAPGTLLYYPVESWGIRDGLDWGPYANHTMDFRAENLGLE